MSYRDELDATRARADAAEQEREEAEAQALAAEERAVQLEQKLRVAQEEAQRLRFRAGAAAPKDELERQLEMVALDEALERRAETQERQKRYTIAFVAVIVVVFFLIATRLYDPILEFLIDDMWGR